MEQLALILHITFQPNHKKLLIHQQMETISQGILNKSLVHPREVFAPAIAKLYGAFEWDNTIVDLSVGEHVIQGLRRCSGMPIRVIFVKKKVTDVSEIRRVKTLDLIEMVQFMLQQKLAHKIKFTQTRIQYS